MSRSGSFNCVVALFFLSALLGGKTAPKDMYEPVVSEGKDRTSYSVREVARVKPDSSKWIKGAVMERGSAEISCYVQPTAFQDVLAVYVGFKNLSSGKKMRMPETPVAGLRTGEGVAAERTSVEAIRAGISEKEKEEKEKSEEFIEGEGLFNPMVRDMKYKGLKEKLSVMDKGLYKPEALKPGESAGGKVYFRAPRADKVNVEIFSGDETYSIDFTRK